MALHFKYKEAFEAEMQYGALYTGGAASWTSSGEEILCQNEGKINVISVDSGNISKVIGEEEKEDVESDYIYTFALSHDDEQILTAHRSGLLKLWSKIDGTLEKMWKSVHNGPVARLCFRARGEIVASGGSDSTVRTWDYKRKVCLSVLHGSQGVMSLLEYHPNLEKTLLFGAGDDNVINCWDFSAKEIKGKLSGHFSKVTGLSFTECSKYLVSVSRDKVMILWDLEKMSQVKVIPLYETLEGVVILPNVYKLPNGYDLSAEENEGQIFVAIAGEHGNVKIWECTKAKIVYSQTNSNISKAVEEGGLAITQLLHCRKTGQIALISADHNIMIHNISTFHCSKQIIGFSDEILDICFIGKKDRYLAVATNSNDIKFYDTSTMNCQVVKGHTDMVLTLSSYKYFLLSGSKDNSIRLWELDPGNFTIKCLAKGTKHTASVGSVAFGHISHTVCASVSQDTCLKIWEVPKQFSTDPEEMLSLKCPSTKIAHEKDINCVTISPNDRLIATASQDKTTKLWSANNLDLIGVLRGHRRGVWSARFSPTDQILATSSADATIKLWSIADLSCLKSFEGHESSVLRAEFLAKGMQILSAGADGLIKVWIIKTSECCTTLDKHASRIWTIAVSQDESYFFSGGSDSQLIKWKDVTEEKKIAEIQAQQEVTLQEQELSNLLAEKKLLKALKLALWLEKPNLSLKIVNMVIQNKEQGLDSTISSLNELQKENLMKHAITWNTNSKNCMAAQLVLSILLNEILSNKFKPSNLDKLIEESLPYTERHFKRLTEFLKDFKFIEFTLKCIQPHARMEIDKK